jgi:hypothetical protein
MELNRKNLMEVEIIEHSLLNNLRFSERDLRKELSKDLPKRRFQKYLSDFMSQILYFRFRI